MTDEIENTPYDPTQNIFYDLLDHDMTLEDIFGPDETSIFDGIDLTDPGSAMDKILADPMEEA